VVGLVNEDLNLHQLLADQPVEGHPKVGMKLEFGLRRPCPCLVDAGAAVGAPQFGPDDRRAVAACE
jgi:hypothetical protein